MDKLRVLIHRILGIIFKQRHDRELQDEIRSHIEMQTEDNLRQGMSSEEAHRASMLKFGGVDVVKEQHRSRRGVPFVETTLSDIRYAIRTLAKNPTFTAVAIIALALGIGANTAIFSAVNSVILRPLPYYQPDRLVIVSNTFLNHSQLFPVSIPQFLDLREKNQVFDDVAAYRETSHTNRTRVFLTGAGEPLEVSGAIASANLFSVLGARAELGRTFVDSDDNSRIAVISDGLWRRSFAADPKIINREITLNQQTFTIVGVMPPDFKLAYPQAIDLWTPIPYDARERKERNRVSYWIIARIKPGLTIQQVRLGLSSVSTQLAQQYPETDSHVIFDLKSLDDYVFGPTRPVFLTLLAAVGFVLLIACVNVSGLLLARATDRAKEIGLRAALGASRARLIRQLITESLVLSLTGGAIGILLAAWSVRVFGRLIPSTIPRGDEVRIDSKVLVYSLIVSITAGLIFGLVPAFFATRFNLNEVLKDGASTKIAGLRTHKIRGLFVILEIGLTLVLLSGAGLLVNSSWRLNRAPLGFNPENALAMFIRLPLQKYRDETQWASFRRELNERVGSIPGVTHAGTSNSVLLHGIDYTTQFTLTGMKGPDQICRAVIRTVDGDFFEAMGMTVLRGRQFTSADLSHATKVGIVNQSFARTFFPDKDPIGKKIYIDNEIEIVGLVNDVRNASLAQPAEPAIYSLPEGLPDLNFCLVLRTSVDPLQIEAAVKDRLRSMDKDQPIEYIAPMSQIVAQSMAETHFYLLMLTAFGVLALTLTAIGIYGMMSYVVAQRTNEVGIRMALGARQFDVIKLIVAQGLFLMTVGIVAGVLGSLGLTKLIAGLLYGVTPTDPATLCAVVVTLSVIAFAACYLPARRATKVDPMIALRYE
ncbi:MAG TPA: ABC transporter permease [Blastocatellia bacterium]|nr:ABC transporter permease [Blastocatellia bacterium]